MMESSTLLQDYMEDGDVTRAIERFHGEMNEVERLEFVVILEKMLWFGPSISMKRFVRILLERCEMPTVIRCRMAEQVYEASDPVYVERIRGWITEPDMEVACRIEWIQKIQYYPGYGREDKVRDWIDHIFLHNAIAPDAFYRHRVVMDVYNIYQIDDMATVIAILREYRQLFEDPVMYKILLTQVLLKRDAEEEEAKSLLAELLEELIKGMQDQEYPFETQADICDFFLNTEYTAITSEHREIAQRTMNRLFLEDMTSELSIYANRQNVHTESIEQSSQKILEKLHETYGNGLSGEIFQQVQVWRQEMEDKWDCFASLSTLDKDRVTVALNRIAFDRRIYGKTGDTLASIMGLVWKHIRQSDHTEELQKRLLEELGEASGQCSSGIAVRLLNTLSGFDDFAMEISYREAILSKVMHHLSSLIMQMEDKERQAILLEEMIVANSQYLERKNFLALFREEIPRIKEKLYKEFHENMTDTDFDLYLRQALIHYEGQSI